MEDNGGNQESSQADQLSVLIVTEIFFLVPAIDIQSVESFFYGLFFSKATIRGGTGL